MPADAGIKSIERWKLGRCGCSHVVNRAAATVTPPRQILRRPPRSPRNADCALDAAHCHYANAIVHGMLDRPDQAWEHFARSRALYLALGMVPPENVSLTVPNAYLDVPGLLTG